MSSLEKGPPKKGSTATRNIHGALFSESLNYVALFRECPNPTKQTGPSAGKYREYRSNDITESR
jgi:hypothetical protein